MWLAPRAAPARRAKRDGAPCAVKALGRRLLARDSVRSRLEVAHPRPALTLRVGAHLLGRLLVTDRASRHPSFLAGSGVRRAVALLSIMGLLGRLAEVIFGLGALRVALWHTRTPAVASGARPAPPAVARR